MKNKIEQFNEAKLQLTDELRKWVLDESIPLDERFNIFINSDLGNEMGWFQCFTPYLKQYLENCQRYQTISMQNVYESFVDNLCYLENVEDESLLSEGAKERLSEFMRNTLINFIKSFEYDW